MVDITSSDGLCHATFCFYLTVFALSEFLKKKTIFLDKISSLTSFTNLVGSDLKTSQKTTRFYILDYSEQLLCWHIFLQTGPFSRKIGL